MTTSTGTETGGTESSSAPDASTQVDVEEVAGKGEGAAPPAAAADPAKTRIYLVTTKDGAPAALVESTSVAAAGRHVLNKNFVVRYARQSDIVTAVKAGISVEVVDEAQGGESA